MIQSSHRTINLLFQAVKLTHPIRLTAEQFYSSELKNLQLYEFDGLIFFKAQNQLWAQNEESGRYTAITPIKTDHVWYATGATL